MWVSLKLAGAGAILLPGVARQGLQYTVSRPVGRAPTDGRVRFEQSGLGFINRWPVRLCLLLVIFQDMVSV